LFGKLDVLPGNLHHVQAILKPAPALFFDPNIVDTVGSKMALLASNNPLEASTKPIEGRSTLSKAMGHKNRSKKSSLGERVRGLGVEFGILVVVGCSLVMAGLLLSWTLLGASFGIKSSR
jgi:hypothetical protein